MASNVSKITVLTEFQNNKLLLPIRQLEGASLSYYKKVLGKNMSSFAKNYYILEINEMKEIRNSSNESSLSDEPVGKRNKNQNQARKSCSEKVLQIDKKNAIPRK